MPSKKLFKKSRLYPEGVGSSLTCVDDGEYESSGDVPFIPHLTSSRDTRKFSSLFPLTVDLLCNYV